MLLPRGRVLIAAAVAAGSPFLLVARSLADTSPAPVTIAVAARDYAFKLSAKTAPVGKLTFAVTNTGKQDHSFQVAGKKTAVLKPGGSAKLVVTFTKPGPFAYTSTVASDAGKGIKGTFTTQAALMDTAGKQAFVTAGCGACHTLKAAGTTGTLGPNLDRSTAPQAAILNAITNGKGTMQAFVDKLTPQQLQDVAEFAYQSRTG